jgi:tetratricopeptide (TPR) repeat protein
VAKPSKKNTDLAFRLRARPGAVETTASEKDILRKIERGKLTGDEQICPESQRGSQEHWEKLSSHPTFYDAFLKRLYKDEYEAPSSPGAPAPRQRRRDTLMERATRQQEAREDNPEGEPDAPGDGRTQQLASSEPHHGTLHQSAIDELFSEIAESEVPVEDSVKKDGLGTDLIAVDLEAPKVDELLKQPLEELTEESVDASASDHGARRRKLIWVGVLTALLMLLFQMGGGSGPSSSSSKDPNKDPGAELKALLGPANKAVRMRALVEEGDHLYENDTPLFYAGARELFREALGYDGTITFVRGRYAEATARVLLEGPDAPHLIEEIKTAIVEGRKGDPQFSQFFRVEAMLALKDKKFEEAKRLLAFASEADPANSDNILIRGEVLFAEGDVKGSEGAFTSVLQAEPANIRARYFIQKTAMARGDLARAQKEAFRTLTLNPVHAVSFFTLAQIAAEENRLKEAKQLYQTCVALGRFVPRGDTARAYYRLGLLQDGAGETEEAKKSYRLAYYYDPANRTAIQEKVKGLDLSDKALTELARANEYGPTYFSEQAENLIAQKKFAESLIFLRAASLLQPSSGAALVRMGEVQEKLVESYNDFQTVVSNYQRAIEREPGLTRAYLKLGLLETEQYNFEAAFKLLKRAQMDAPRDPDVFVAMGKYFYRAKDYNSAIEQFKTAYEKNPYDSEIHYYAGLLALLGRKDGQRDATGFFYKAYLLNPNNYEALVEWAKLKVLGYEKNFALKFVRNLIDQDPKNAHWYWALGEIYAANKEFRRAITFYHQALDIDNHQSKVRMALGKSLEAVGETEAAIAEYRVASMIDRRNSEGFYRASELLLQLKNYKEAEEALKYLISVTPNYPGAHRTLAQIYQTRDQKDKAIEEMHQEVTNNPENLQFHLDYAQLLMDFGKFEPAVLELTDITNLPALAKPESAYEKVRAFLLLSRCYRELNRFDSAEGTIRLALETDPDDPELHRELGYVYHGLQRDKEAVAAFQFYLNRSPAASDAVTIKAIIQNSIIDE